MASSERSPAPLPLGFVEPTERDFGALAREVVRLADERRQGARSRAWLLLVPGLLFYLLFALGVDAVLWALSINVAGAPHLALVTATFLVMALLGQYYRNQASWTMVTGGMGRLHSVLLVQAFLLKLLTAAFFILPYKALRNISRLFPRRPVVDSSVLSVAVQTLAALDDPVAVDELAAILPREIPRRAVDEACLLLFWSGLAEVVPQGGQRMLLPTEERRRLLATLPEDASPAVRVSDLRQRGAVAGLP